MIRSIQQKNTYNLLTRLPIVLLAGSLFFYLIMRWHARHMEREQLELKQQNIWNAFSSGREVIPPAIKAEYSLQEIPLSGRIPGILSGEPRDTSIYYPESQKWVSFGILSNAYTLHNKTWLLTTYTSSKEINHLIIKAFATEAGVFILLMAAIVVVNRKSSGKLWGAFYNTLAKSKQYDILQNKELALPDETGTLEFDQLNQVLSRLINHVNLAYNNQKQFTENAAHELQTPLAIIRSKLDLLINEPGLTEEMARLLADITAANERMSQLNKNLLLLAKISNHQFPEQTLVDVSAILGRITGYYIHPNGENQMDFGPEIHISNETKVFIYANSSLIEVLFSNLIHNSIVHNLPGGYVRIQLEPGLFLIENSGPELMIATEQLFERFKKGQEGSKTTGLGLSLVKQICLLYLFELRYENTGSTHRVSIKF